MYWVNEMGTYLHLNGTCIKVGMQTCGDRKPYSITKSEAKTLGLLGTHEGN